MPDRAVMLSRARALRAGATDTERRVWSMLRGRALEGLKFRRQVPLGPYIADFACFDPKIIVECDGGQHVDNAYDETRDAWFRAQGFKVLRFWNADVLREPDGVAYAILAVLRQASRDPSPSHGATRRGPLPPPQGGRCGSSTLEVWRRLARLTHGDGAKVIPVTCRVPHDLRIPSHGRGVCAATRGRRRGAVERDQGRGS